MSRPTRRHVLRDAALSIGTCLLRRDADAALPLRVFPGSTWAWRAPQEVGLSAARLEELRTLVGGRGCVSRRGYLTYEWGNVSFAGDIFSAAKPVISTLLLMAVQERRLRSVTQTVASVNPALAALNGGKEARIAWRHLATMTSGYGLIERPGAAFAYNDYALALFYQSLMDGVYESDGNLVLRTRLGERIGFEDSYQFGVAGDDNPGRLAMSVRDLARFGLLFLRQGAWAGRRVLQPSLVRLALGSPVPARLPFSSGQEAGMLPGQLTLGGGKTGASIGPGYYSYNWWLNRKDRFGRRLFHAMPPDAYVASGLWGRDMLWVVPSLDLVVSWSGSEIRDHQECPANSHTDLNRAARLILLAARR